MAGSVRFKTFAEEVEEAKSGGVKGQTTVKVVTAEGEIPVQTLFVDENTKELVLVAHGLIGDTDPDDAEELSEWRAERNGGGDDEDEKPSKKSKKGKAKSSKSGKADKAEKSGVTKKPRKKVKASKRAR